VRPVLVLVSVTVLVDVTLPVTEEERLVVTLLVKGTVTDMERCEEFVVLNESVKLTVGLDVFVTCGVAWKEAPKFDDVNDADTEPMWLREVERVWTDESEKECEVDIEEDEDLDPVREVVVDLDAALEVLREAVADLSRVVVSDADRESVEDKVTARLKDEVSE
jgi:hypothetical protein